MHPFLKFALLIGAVILVVITIVHILPWLIGIVCVCAVIKLYHWLKQPPDNRPPPRWPWRDR